MTKIVDAYPSQSITLGGKSIATSRASVGAEAELLVAANASRGKVIIRNTHASQVLYIGEDADVATSTGFRVLAEGGVVELETTAAIYAIASGAATTVEVLETIV